VPNFTHFKPIGVQRQFSQTNFQKLSYFKLIIFVFFNSKKLHKNVESKEARTTKPKEMPTSQGAKVVEPRKVLMNKAKAKIDEQMNKTNKTKRGINKRKNKINKIKRGVNK